MTGNVQLGVDVSLSPLDAFDVFVDELSLALDKRGMKFDPLEGGSVREGNYVVGFVEEWKPGTSLSMLWHPKNWEDNTENKLSVTFTATTGGTRITIESQDWGRVLRDDKTELLGWFTSEIAAQLFLASSPNRLGDWITDRNARSPSGARSRQTYRNPTYHMPNFLAILELLSLGPDDYLLEVGCGGGAFLKAALKTGCRAAAIDHSADMIRLATEENRDAISKHRLSLTKSEADSIPYPHDTFTCAVMTGVLAFLPDALVTFREISRVLKRGGRFVAFTSTKELKGTPATPEPIASRVHFYEDGELESMLGQAGFSSVRIEHRSFYDYAKRAGVPETDLQLFRGTTGSQLIVAQKD